jgi:hypothetical protein
LYSVGTGVLFLELKLMTHLHLVPRYGWSYITPHLHMLWRYQDQHHYICYIYEYNFMFQMLHVLHVHSSTEEGVSLQTWVRIFTLYSFKYNQQDAMLYNILYYCQCSTCFRQFLRPSSGAQNCTHSSLTYQMVCVQFWAPDDGRKNCLKHVEHWL